MMGHATLVMAACLFKVHVDFFFAERLNIQDPVFCTSVENMGALQNFMGVGWGLSQYMAGAPQGDGGRA